MPAGHHRSVGITDQWDVTALHFAALHHRDPVVLELLIREHPLALCVTNISGRTPQQLATVCNVPAAIISLLIDATNALVAGDYAALAFRVHGSAFALCCLASPSYAARIAIRTSLLLCLNTTHPSPRRARHVHETSRPPPRPCASVQSGVVGVERRVLVKL